MTQDVVLRIISKETNIRGLFADTTELTQEAAGRHNTTGAATKLLAEVLTGGVLFGALLKVRQRVALKFEGSGPAQKVIVESDSYGHVRGYIAVPDLAPLGEMTSAEALGAAGLLTVTKDVKLKDLVEGVVHLETSEVDRDLTFYLTQSDQTPSLVNIGVVVDQEGKIVKSGGLLLQAMPPFAGDNLEEFANRLQELPPLASLLSEGKAPSEIASLVMQGDAYDELENRPVSFRCQCSRERSRKALMLLEASEIQSIIDEVGEAVIDCHFCHEQYRFSAEDLREIMQQD